MNNFTQTIKKLFWPQYARDALNRFLISIVALLVFTQVLSHVSVEMPTHIFYRIVLYVLFAWITVSGIRASYLSRREFLHSTVDLDRHLDSHNVWNGVDFSPLTMSQRGGRNDIVVYLAISFMIMGAVLMFVAMVVLLSGVPGQNAAGIYVLLAGALIPATLGCLYLFKNREKLFKKSKMSGYEQFAMINDFVYEEHLALSQVSHLEQVDAFYNKRANGKYINFQLSGKYLEHSFSFTSVTFKFRKGVEFIGIVTLEVGDGQNDHSMSEFQDIIRDVENRPGFVHAICENGIPKDRMSTLKLFRFMDEVIKS